ncbi:outer membrane protein assembly factor BamE [Massilia sp. Dwa41.01b]|uniref:outer membrane protein assembly factor BamE n=1 Tax=unclassified Massilia TaxID=2609279 RepID=UPI00185F5106|nr:MULTISPECIES: outer membrane protein assembly factor BamE [unclassified Massilia]QNA90659.1 outer membrane protein assembly factor BamE [Massilia sp. Dwa41.01b]QNA97891.1 outer membrane protein assembly factor BamE [Massilia sp. Se16.2.3]
MRVFDAVVHRFHARAALAAGLACTLLLSGCASWRNQTKPAAPVSTAPAAVEADASKSAALANAGAQTTQATKLQKFLWVFSPYRPDIQQGNFVSQEMLAQLKVGQTREQVRFLLGTPLLMDMFHADRWDYPFYLARGNGELTTSRVTVYFKGDVVERFDGANLPTEREYIERIAGPIKSLKKEDAAQHTKPAAAPSVVTPANGQQIQ